MGANSSVPATYSKVAYAILSLDIVLVTGVVAGRAVSQALVKATPVADDYLCYFAFTATLGLLVSGLLLTANGALDLSRISVQRDEAKRFDSAVFVSLAVLYIFSITFIKLSILFLYRRTCNMYKSRCTTWSWWLILNLSVVWILVCLILVALQASNKIRYDDFCRFGISSTGIANSFLGILLLIQPAIMISRIKLQKKERIALLLISGIGGLAAVTAGVRGIISIIERDYSFNEAYTNYLHVILTATESTAGLMCACLPLTEPIFVRVTRWFQKLRRIDTNPKDWTAAAASANTARKNHDRSILRVDDYHVQMLPMSKFTDTQTTSQNGEIMNVEQPWQSLGPYENITHCESNKNRRPGSPIARHWGMIDSPGFEKI